MTNNTTPAPRLARELPKAEDFAPIDWTKVDTSRNHQRAARRSPKRKTIR